MESAVERKSIWCPQHTLPGDSAKGKMTEARISCTVGKKCISNHHRFNSNSYLWAVEFTYCWETTFAMCFSIFWHLAISWRLPNLQYILNFKRRFKSFLRCTNVIQKIIMCLTVVIGVKEMANQICYLFTSIWVI